LSSGRDPQDVQQEKRTAKPVPTFGSLHSGAVAMRLTGSFDFVHFVERTEIDQLAAPQLTWRRS
jgi:hypothetical protein